MAKASEYHGVTEGPFEEKFMGYSKKEKEEAIRRGDSDITYYATKVEFLGPKVEEKENTLNSIFHRDPTVKSCLKIIKNRYLKDNTRVGAARNLPKEDLKEVAELLIEIAEKPETKQYIIEIIKKLLPESDGYTINREID